MSKNVTVLLDELKADVRDGAIDTVLAVFADHQGRMIGKRTDAEFFFDIVLDKGTENCDYLLACDLDYTPLAGFHGRATTRVTATCAASSITRRSATCPGSTARRW